MATIRLLPFDVSNVTDLNLRNVDFVRGKINEATQAVTVRDAEIERLGGSNAEFGRQLTIATQNLSLRESELASAKKELAVQAERNQKLGDELEKIKTQTRSIGIQELVSQVKSGVDRINMEVLAKRAPGMLVDGVEVEVRGGIDVADGLKITQLPGSVLAENNVSMLRFALRPSSPLKIVDEGDETTG